MDFRGSVRENGFCLLLFTTESQGAPLTDTDEGVLVLEDDDVAEIYLGEPSRFVVEDDTAGGLDEDVTS